jgi:transcriptional regulator with XRE-family HTH domain/quercetin dioxygenase-like cupin family protein
MSKGSQDPAEVGRQIAALRRERGMKMVDLSRAAGVSPSMISQIERGHALPSVGTLYAIAEALAITVHDLFAAVPAAPPTPTDSAAEANATLAPGGDVEPTMLEHLSRGDPALNWAGPDPAGPVVRRDQRQFSELAGGVRCERLTPSALPDLDILATVYRPGATSSEHLYRHQGREMHLVTEGRIVVELAFQRYELEAGDSITFDSTEPHRYSNPFRTTAHGLTVLMLARPG